jgi:hypothetical protein
MKVGFDLKQKPLPITDRGYSRMRSYICMDEPAQIHVTKANCWVWSGRADLKQREQARGRPRTTFIRAPCAGASALPLLGCFVVGSDRSLLIWRACILRDVMVGPSRRFSNSLGCGHAISGAAGTGRVARFRSMIEPARGAALKRFGAKRQEEENWSGRADLNLSRFAGVSEA